MYNVTPGRVRVADFVVETQQCVLCVVVEINVTVSCVNRLLHNNAFMAVLFRRQQ